MKGGNDEGRRSSINEPSMIKMICQNCGKEFETYECYVRRNGHPFCGPDCGSQGQRHWNKGLTKETDKRLEIMGQKISKANKGKPTWSKGLTKEISKNLRSTSQKLLGIHNPMYGKRHTIKERRKQSAAHKGKPTWNKGKKGIFSETALNKISLASKKNWQKPGYRENIQAKVRAFWDCPKNRERQSIRITGTKRTALTKQKLRDRWNDPNYAQKCLRARIMKKPTKLELFFDERTPSIVRYVGNGDWFIRTNGHYHNPDFKISGQKKIIELWGNYWHKGKNPTELIEEYKIVGWDCLIFWESEVYNKIDIVLKKVKQFIKVGKG